MIPLGLCLLVGAFLEFWHHTGKYPWLSSYFPQSSVGLSQVAEGELGWNFCLLQFQAQIDHYLGLVNKNVKDAMAK